jgi:hypothetical protein
VWPGFYWQRIVVSRELWVVNTAMSLLERGGGFLGQLNSYQLINKAWVPWNSTFPLQRSCAYNLWFCISKGGHINMAAFWDIAPYSLVDIDRFFSRPDDGGITLLWNVYLYLPYYTAQYPRRQRCSYSSLW